MPSKNAVFRTLAYADIFDFPLTEKELYKFLIAQGVVDRKSVKKSSQEHDQVEYKDGYYLLKNRGSIVALRKRREVESRKKLRLAKKVARRLFVLPSVLLIGVSGNLSMHNAEDKDDIDLFIISYDNTLWITRGIILFLLSLLGIRRKRGEKNVADKICLNVMVERSFLSLPEKRRNLYTAHEVAQVLPLFDREDTYEKFIRANLWGKRFMPHAFDGVVKGDLRKKHTLSFISLFLRYPLPFSAINFFAKKIQIWYIKKHMTQEVITDNTVFFHPKDYAEKILKAFEKRIQAYEKV